MAVAKKGGNFKPRPLAPVGTHYARCIGVIELGTQKGVWNGQEKLQEKIHFVWEIIGKKAVFDEAKGPQPFVVSETYTHSLADNAGLRKMLLSWRGKQFTPEQEENGFDCQKCLGQPCMITIVHNNGKGQNASKIYANVQAVIACPDDKKKTLPKAENESVGFVIGNPDQFEIYEKLYKHIKEKVDASPEWQAELVKHKKAPAPAASAEEEESTIHTGQPDEEDQF